MGDIDLAYLIAIGTLIVCVLGGIEVWARDITDHNKDKED